MESNHCTHTVQLKWKKCPSPTSLLWILSYSAPEKKIPIDRTLRHLYFFLVCLKIFPNYQFYEEQKTREGAGILINFSADTMFNLRLYFHFKTPQKRYCKSPAGPQHKARLLIKSWNGSCQVCLQGCATLAVHTTCLLRPRLNYWQNGQTTRNWERYVLPMKIMIVLGTAHML